MPELVYVDSWSSLHVIANLCIGMYTGAKHYNFPKSLAAVTTIGIIWEIIEWAYPDSNETMKDHITDVLLNTLGFATGYALGNELKK